MNLKVLFLTIVAILAVAGAGSFWVWQNKEAVVPQPIVQEPQDGTPDVNTDVEVMEPKINPETGWKIFEHPQVPITFEYPGEMRVVKVVIVNDKGRLPGPFVVLRSVDYALVVDFALPTSDGGYAWGFAELIEEWEIVANGKKYKTGIRGDSHPNSDVITFYTATSLPRPFVVAIDCNEYGCLRDEMRSLFRQFVSSIKILPE